jgi:hypothetical protein
MRETKGGSRAFQIESVKIDQEGAGWAQVSPGSFSCSLCGEPDWKVRFHAGKFTGNEKTWKGAGVGSCLPRACMIRVYLCVGASERGGGGIDVNTICCSYSQ